MSVTIYGCSDDLIEIEGDIRDEFSAYDCWKYLHFDEGTVVKVGYALVDGKGWDVEVVKEGTATATMLEPVLDDGEHYTDRLQLDGVEYVECWSRKTGPDSEDMETFWESFEPSDYPLSKLVAAYRVLRKSEGASNG